MTDSKSKIELALEEEFNYIEIDNDVSLKNIEDLFCNGIVGEPITGIECLYYGRYYYLNKQYDKMIGYYLIGIEKYGCSEAMKSLGYYYEEQEDYDNMMKYVKLLYVHVFTTNNLTRYYLMSIEKGNSNALYNLGSYYEEQRNYDKMMNYYLEAIAYGNSNAMCSLGNYYKKQKDYDKMMSYYLMAIENGNCDALVNLGLYYSKIRNFDKMMEYYTLAIKRGNTIAMYNLGTSVRAPRVALPTPERTLKCYQFAIAHF